MTSDTMRSQRLQATLGAARDNNRLSNADLAGKWDLMTREFYIAEAQ